MATKPTYEFEDDDAPKPERKAFIPGLDEAPVAPAAAAPASQAAKPGTGSFARQSAPVGATPAPAAPAADPVEYDDPDLKPGSRKDLWRCPHCGAGNKPDRLTCRTCNKSPSQPVEPPVWAKPPLWIGVGVSLLLVIVIWILTRPDLSLRPAGPSSVDRAPRIGSVERYEKEAAGKTFAARKRIAVCGRVIISRGLEGVPGVMQVVLALGDLAAGADLRADIPVTFNNDLVDAPEDTVVLNLITSDPIDVTRGAYLSVVGDAGLLSDGALLVQSAEVGYTVLVEKLRQ
jgi:hypothetical protein